MKQIIGLLALAFALMACATPTEHVAHGRSGLSSPGLDAWGISDAYVPEGWDNPKGNGVTYKDAADRCVSVRGVDGAPTSGKVVTKPNMALLNCATLASVNLVFTTRDESAPNYGDFDVRVRRLLRAYDGAVGWKYASAGVQWTGTAATGIGTDVSDENILVHVNAGTVAHSVDITSLVASWWTGSPAHGLLIEPIGPHAYVQTATISFGATCAEPPPVCGNGVKTGVESCDDGNVFPGDGCSSSCATETGYACAGTPSVCLTVCGDGITAGSEACDDGNTVTTDGCVLCELAECGDGFVQAGGEQCDDGNTSNLDGCLNTCEVATCGDGFTGPGEACDDGNAVATDSCVGCAIAYCGDGVTRATVEECDDGNEVSGDGCSADCLMEVCSCEVP